MSNEKCKSIYPLIDRLEACSKINHPDRPWTPDFYFSCAFAWLGKEKELEARCVELESKVIQSKQIEP